VARVSTACRVLVLTTSVSVRDHRTCYQCYTCSGAERIVRTQTASSRCCIAVTLIVNASQSQCTLLSRLSCSRSVFVAATSTQHSSRFALLVVQFKRD
jgi:hypothetical protein